jgi:Fur family ferric uptake transcriptional regulator
MSSNFSLGKVEVSLTPTERFEEFLKSRGKRVTQQRRMIVEDVFAQHDHFNADELCDVLQKAGRDVSRPTVYRTLNEMVEAGLLRKMTIGSRSVYELDYGYPQHDHLYCEKCDKLMEFQSEEIVRIREQVAREFSFRVSGHRFIVYGICDECQKRTRRRPRRLEMV